MALNIALTAGGTCAALLVGWRCVRSFASQRPTASLVLISNKACLEKKRVLITGACSGIGRELALRTLEHCDVKGVWLHGRSADRVQDVINSFPEEVRGRCFPAIADFADLRSVQDMADAVKAEPPDVVVCCAGVSCLPQRVLTVDGYETQFAVNHLAHFLLMTRLLPALPSSARVVVVSSSLKDWMCKLDLENLNSQKSYGWMAAYLASKYCNVLFMRELHSRGTCAVSCTPGETDTQISRNLSPLLGFIFRYLGPGMLARPVGEGAATVAHCMTDEVESGAFYEKCEIHKLGGDQSGKALWQMSEEMVAAALRRS